MEKTTISSAQVQAAAAKVQKAHYLVSCKITELESKSEEGIDVSAELHTLGEQILTFKSEAADCMKPSFLNQSKKKEWYERYFNSFYSDYERKLNWIRHLLNAKVEA